MALCQFKPETSVQARESGSGTAAGNYCFMSRKLQSTVCLLLTSTIIIYK